MEPSDNTGFLGEGDGIRKKSYIDTLRALSVCLVFLYHYNGGIGQLGISAPPIFYGFKNGNWGNVGVFLFFMISGNVLYHKYGKTMDYKAYFKNRFRRIFPLFWLCYVLAFLYNFWKTKAFPNIPLYKLILTVCGMDGFLAYRTETFYILGEWFLGCIIIVYILFPFIRLCINKNIHITLVVLFLSSCLIFYNNFWGMFQIASRRNVIVALFYFVLGIWIEKILILLKKKMQIITACIFSFLGLLILFVELPVNEYICYLFLNISIFIFVFSVNGFFAESKIVKPFIQILSRESYAIFIVHHIVIQEIIVHFIGNIYSLKGILCILALCILVTFVCIQGLNYISLKVNGLKKFNEL